MWPSSNSVTRELSKVTGCQALPHPRGRATDGRAHQNMRSPDPCGLVPGSPCGWRASRRSPEAMLPAQMAQNRGRGCAWASMAAHLGTCPLVVSQRWVWFLEPTGEKRGIRNHETLLRGLQVDPQLRSAVSEFHTCVPSVTPAGVPCAKCASSEICAVSKACPFLTQPFCQPSDVLCVFSSSQK